jgi:hypothetical protein
MPHFKPNELAERRSEQAGDCRQWTPKDALLAALRDIESGKINPTMLVISYREPSEVDNEVYYRYYAAGVTAMEHAGLLAMHLARVTSQ